ncbi:MAG: hypothetical protein K5765_08840, partial [Clostridia bacterium]|nr:hypothetical protein [Clostridia bacterium]
GIIGLIIYTYLALVRLKTFIGFKIRTFNVFLLIGFLAFALYSVVDVATAIPMPFIGMITFMLVVCEKYSNHNDFTDIRFGNHFIKNEIEKKIN